MCARGAGGIVFHRAARNGCPGHERRGQAAPTTATAAAAADAVRRARAASLMPARRPAGPSCRYRSIRGDKIALETAGTELGDELTTSVGGPAGARHVVLRTMRRAADRCSRYAGEMVSRRSSGGEASVTRP